MKKIEYVFFISSDCAVCKNKAKLKSFLSSSELALVKEELSLDNECCKIKITEKKTKNSDGIVYTVVFSVDSDKEPVKLLKTFRQVICSIKDNSQKKVTILELQNDFAKSRSEKLYTNIYTLENTMRRLISRFMLESLGMEWFDATPQDVKKSVKDNEYKWNNDCLYHLDFIQLSYFLTTPYADNNDNLLEELKKCITNGFSESDKEKLKSFIPKNNWDRYFKELVSCDSKKFKSMWEKLYDYRCDIAHNRIIANEGYEDCLRRCNEMQKIIDEAIAKLDKVEISEQEKRNTAERTLDGVGISIKSYMFPKELLSPLSSMTTITNPIKSFTDQISSICLPVVKSFEGINAFSKCFPDPPKIASLDLLGKSVIDSCKFISPQVESISSALAISPIVSQLIDSKTPKVGELNSSFNNYLNNKEKEPQ